MSYHIVNIDSPRCEVLCQRGQLVCRAEGQPDKSLPLEDVAAIVITSFSAHLHSHLLLEAARHGVALVICESFKPVSLLLPANRSSDTLLTKASLALPKATSETLWRKTIDAKCANQAAVAAGLSPKHPKLPTLQRVARGRSQYKEAACARVYWGLYGQTLADLGFRREPGAEGLNSLLNYGYAVLLSLVLQKLFALGLDPTFGLAHAPRERSTPLAYDLMEPFRPAVDQRVAQWVQEQQAAGDYRLTLEFRRWVTGFTLERVGHLGIELQLHHCVESVLRGFRKAVLFKQARFYRPWTLNPSDSKWAG
jgi:CRISP-associated protein Cas1